MVTQKLGQLDREMADRLMQLFLQVFGSKNSTVQEEALMAVGAVANGATATRRPPPPPQPRGGRPREEYQTARTLTSP